MRLVWRPGAPSFAQFVKDGIERCGRENLDKRICREQTLCMARPLDELIHDALALSSEERVWLLARIEDSLAEPVDSKIEQAWADEVDRRVAEIDRGEVEMIPWEEVRAKLHRRFVR